MSGNATYRLETPENVELHFELAGPGSRFCAICIDTVIIACGILAIGLLLLLGGVALPRALFEADFFTDEGHLVSSWVVALAMLAIAVVSSSYHLVFELFMHGQTPGKRAMKIRAISDDGSAMIPSQVLVRNVLRTVDFLPVLYTLGGVVSLFSSLHKRIGDLAAGTIVVKEGDPDYRAASDVRYDPTPMEPIVSNAELSPEEARLIRNFLSRRDEFLPSARAQLAHQIGSELYRRYGGTWDDAERYLERLLGGRHR